jgi:Xaa-Pro aminopeptidase
MRRGLISWSKSELPDAVFAARIARAQAALADAGLDAFVTYVNITRPAAASWFTGFVPYWSEGLMVLGRSGGATLYVALSKRVQGWIERTAAVERVVSTPRFGAEAAKHVAALAPNARVGVLERDQLPAGTAAALQSADATLVDATPLYERLREAADPAEIALTARAADIAREALATVRGATDAHDALARVERAARLAGAEDVFVALAPDLRRAVVFRRAPFAEPALGDRFAIRLTVAYKGHWTRLTRTFARDDAAGTIVAEARLAAAIAALPDATALAALDDWLVEGTPHSQPLEALAGSSVGAARVPLGGKVVTVTATIDVDGQRFAAGGPVLVGTGGSVSAALVLGTG